jgi:hypothetical protein
MTRGRHPVLLGPCPCQVCGRLLVWDGLDWTFRGSNIVHRRETCPGPGPMTIERPERMVPR